MTVLKVLVFSTFIILFGCNKKSVEGNREVAAVAGKEEDCDDESIKKLDEKIETEDVAEFKLDEPSDGGCTLDAAH